MRFQRRRSVGHPIAQGVDRTDLLRRVLGLIGLLSGLGGIVALGLEPQGGSWVLLVLSAVCVVVWRLIPRFPQIGPFCGHGVLALILTVAVSLAIDDRGGFRSPAMFMPAVLPIAAAFLLGRRATWIWAVLCGLVPVGLYLGRDLVPGPAMTVEFERTFRFVTIFFAVAFVTAVAMAYERGVRVRQGRLEATQTQLEHSNEAKSVFLRTMSHEIRTPLSTVLGIVDLLETSETDPARVRQVATISASGRTLLGLVDDILDLTRIESGDLVLEQQPVNLNDLVSEIALVFGERVRQRGLGFSCVFEGHPWVSGDALRLRQIVMNLLGNALKFTSEGRIEVTVRSALNAETGRVSVVIEVSDTGIGIAESARATLFAPFEQAERGTSRRFGGSGLGLSIVAGLAERMGGQVEVHSILGQGSRFRTLLVLLSSPPALPHAPARAPARGVRVLLAEDNRVNQEVFRALLESVGCCVRIAEHGKEALRLIAAEAPELVLMDCQMPEMDGLTATRLLRESGFWGPIVALTANTTSADRAACLDAGMDDFLSKPATRAQLQAVVLRWGGRGLSV